MEHVTFGAFLFCRQARKGEKDASRRLSEMIANYGDVIPRRDYEQLQKENEVTLPDVFALEWFSFHLNEVLLTCYVHLYPIVCMCLYSDEAGNAWNIKLWLKPTENWTWVS